MRLRKPCEHGRYDKHHPEDGSQFCPGGEFLADDALVARGLFCATYEELIDEIVRRDALSDALTVREEA